MKKYQILQVKESAENSRYIKFSSLEMLEHLGLKVTRDMYEIVWEGEVDESETVDGTLEDIFRRFNIGAKPEDYKGHSLSVSDIVRLDDKYYYCDSYSFEQIEF